MNIERLGTVFESQADRIVECLDDLSHEVNMGVQELSSAGHLEAAVEMLGAIRSATEGVQAELNWWTDGHHSFAKRVLNDLNEINSNVHQISL